MRNPASAHNTFSTEHSNPLLINLLTNSLRQLARIVHKESREYRTVEGR